MGRGSQEGEGGPQEALSSVPLLAVINSDEHDRNKHQDKAGPKQESEGEHGRPACMGGSASKSQVGYSNNEFAVRPFARTNTGATATRASSRRGVVTTANATHHLRRFLECRRWRRRSSVAYPFQGPGFFFRRLGAKLGVPWCGAPTPLAEGRGRSHGRVMSGPQHAEFVMGNGSTIRNPHDIVSFRLA